MWDDIVVEAVLCHLDPVDLIRAAGVCKTWRRLARHKRFWTRFISNGSCDCFIKEPVKRKPRFMFLKERDWALLSQEQRILVESSQVMRELAVAGVITIWMLKWSQRPQLNALKSILSAQQGNVHTLIYLHSNGYFSIEDILNLLGLSYPCCVIYQALSFMRSPSVAMLLQKGVLTFVDLVQTALSCGSDLSKGGLSNLNFPRLCVLISSKKATLHEIACLSVPEATRIREDFLWQYVESGMLPLSQARSLSVSICTALEQRELFQLIQDGEITIQRALSLPNWALYNHRIVKLWQARLITEEEIKEMTGDFYAGINEHSDANSVVEPEHSCGAIRNTSLTRLKETRACFSDYYSRKKKTGTS